MHRSQNITSTNPHLWLTMAGINASCHHFGFSAMSQDCTSVQTRFLPQLLNNQRQGEQRLLEQIDAVKLLSSSLQWLKIRRDHSHWTHLSQKSFSIMEITAGRKLVFSSPNYTFIHTLSVPQDRDSNPDTPSSQHRIKIICRFPPPFICGRHEERW